MPPQRPAPCLPPRKKGNLAGANRGNGARTGILCLLCFLLLAALLGVPDWARLLVSSSNWLFTLVLSFLLYLARWGLGRNVARAPPRSRGCSRVELTRPHRAAQLSAGFFALPEEAHAVVDALFACRRLWISLRFVRQPEAGQRHARESDAE